jgi:hypothetical protein
MLRYSNFSGVSRAKSGFSKKFDKLKTFPKMTKYLIHPNIRTALSKIVDNNFISLKVLFVALSANLYHRFTPKTTHVSIIRIRLQKVTKCFGLTTF